MSTGAPTGPQGTGEMHFAIRYVSRYRYDADVVDNLNALRVRPGSTSRQQVDEFSVRLTPEARLHRHNDYYGTEVVEFEVSRPHRELVVDVRAQVTTGPPRTPPSPSWNAARTGDYVEAAGEYLFQTENAPGNPVLDELLVETGLAPDPLALLLRTCELIPSRFEYRRGATYVDSPLNAVLDGGAGVCQDFVHLALCILRHHGIGARYVSGYLYTTDAADPAAVPADNESVEVDTHAWIEALLPGDDGEPVWIGADPTNTGLATERHIKIGHGRHYADIPPIKGVYRGVANAEVDARVTMTRLDGPEAVAARG